MLIVGSTLNWVPSYFALHFGVAVGGRRVLHPVELALFDVVDLGRTVSDHRDIDLVDVAAWESCISFALFFSPLGLRS